MAEQSELESNIKRLTDEVARLNGHRFVRIHNSTTRLVMFQFARGLAFGLGTAIGATALVSFVALVLAQFEFVPYLGDLAVRVMEEIQKPR